MHAATALDERQPTRPFVPRVRLFSERLLVESERGGYEEHRVPVLSLRFDYGDALHRPAARRDQWFDTLELDGASRDLVGEARFQRLIESHGAVDIDCAQHVTAVLGSEADYLVQSDDDVHNLCAFSAEAVPRLREHGIVVEIDADYPYQVVNAEAGFYARVERKNPNWFALELGIELNGQRVNLVPALVDLIASSGELSSLRRLAQLALRPRALRIDDNRWITLPPDRLERVLAVLTDLYTGRSTRDEIRFRATAALVLADLVTALSARGTRWHGDVGVLERARRFAQGPELTPSPVALNALLRPYQLQGLMWMQHLRKNDAGGVLADDMGLGKTLQTIALFTCEKEARRLDRPCLVVVPTSLVWNWQRELGRFAPHLRTLVWHGGARRKLRARLESAEVVITTYALLCRDLGRFRRMRFHYVVLDEAQAIKNPRSQAARAARCLEARHRLCLTGTPLENNLEELWSIFDFAMPGLLGSADEFRRRYRHPIETRGATSELEALRDRLAPYVLRRLKESVASELPPKTELVRFVELEQDQRDLYESIRVAAHADVRRAIRNQGFRASTVAVLDALMKLRQACCDPRLVSIPGARDVSHSAKLDALLGLLSKELAHGRRVLVFSQFTRMLALISEALLGRGIRHLILTGSTVDRRARVDAFERGKADVFLISLKAGGTGLNLTSADTVVHYEPWWNAAAQLQATDRAHRIGQTRPVFVHDLIVAGSVEQRMLELQRKKRRLADALLGKADAPVSALCEEDVEDLFAPLK